MPFDHFKTALLGPITRTPLSVAGSCADCVAKSSPADADNCAGFGPGCLGWRRTSPAATTPEDLAVHFGLPGDPA